MITLGDERPEHPPQALDPQAELAETELSTQADTAQPMQVGPFDPGMVRAKADYPMPAFKTDVEIHECENGWWVDVKSYHSVTHRKIQKLFVFNILDEMLKELRTLLADPEGEEYDAATGS